MKQTTVFLQVIKVVSLAWLLTATLFTTTGQSFYNEAPQLTALVADGTLPIVDERLPINPVIVQPVDQVGTYGGTWNMVMRGSPDRVLVYRTLAYENLVRWDEQWTRVVPNVAQSVEVNEDASEYTFTLRRGMRWSDGAPFTADDIMFWYEDVLNNEILTGSIDAWLLSEGEPVVVEKVDDFTVTFRFTTPNGLFLQNLAHPDGSEITAYPRHYLEQFHEDYNADIDDLIAEAGAEDWEDFFESKIPNGTRRIWPADLPTLNAWAITTPDAQDSDVGDVIVAERNPYYWKVDTDFNQLPYIDRVEYLIVEDSDAVFEEAIVGNIDMQSRRIPSSARTEENQAIGGYGIFQTIGTTSNEMVIALNLTHDDPAKRQLFSDLNFRIGLSHAIDRQRIINTVEGNQPYQVGPIPTSPFYNEQLATQYIDFDTDLANDFIDQTGFTERNDDGYRIGPDGEPITITVLISDDRADDHVPSFEIIREDWATVGVAVMWEVVSRDELNERVADNLHDAAAWVGDGGQEVMLDPRWYLPSTVTGTDSFFGIKWVHWAEDPTHPLAEEPPPAVRQQMDLYRQLLATADEDRQAALMAEVLEIAADQFYVMGTAIDLSPSGGIVRNNFFNVPSLMPSSWTYPTPAPANTAQFFIEPQA